MLQELRRDGLSISAIARRTGMDRKTVRKLPGRGLATPAYSPREPRPRLLEPYEGYLADKIGVWPDLSGRRLFREIRELGYEGGYTAVTDYLRSVRPDAAPRFERRFETKPGEQAQADFAEFTAGFDEVPDVVRKVHLFSFVLGCSRWLWGRFCADQRLENVLWNPDVRLIWREAEPNAHRAALKRLAAKVTHVGHSASFMQAWVEQDSEVVPDWELTNGIAACRLRVPSPGSLERLARPYQEARNETERAEAELKTMLPPPRTAWPQKFP